MFLRLLAATGRWPRATAHATLLLVGLLLFAGPAHAAVTVEEIVVPERTAAGKAFDVVVRLQNVGPARDVHLFGALYAPVDGKAPCGPTTDPSFRTFTHVVQVTIALPADAEVVHPPEGERWLHAYDPKDAPATPADHELCVFVAAATGGPVIQYEAYGVATLSVRARNAPPQPAFRVETPTPTVSRPVTFVAEAVDSDDDPVTYTWDFGRFDATGRARAEGERVTHAFYPEGEYTVTLTATDGIDAVPLARTIVISAAGDEQTERASRTPLGAWLAPLAVGLALVLRRRW